ncbi:hypothetical protein RRG08_052536 [Elysia crispata]|uniref:Transmembrane protein n=1 Tax=Elysia crispata TaxID=231223 RepID=A0AAE1DG02_9GAST|nr:hypothetical protein RRG08_052536 [Elysia crispata]
MIRFYEGGGCNKALIVGYREVALVPTILIGLSLVLTGLAKCVETVMSERVTENMHRTQDEDEDIESGKEQEIVSNNEAESAISTLRLYLQQHESTSEDLSTLLNNMERRLSKIMTTAKKQSSIKSFFKPIQKDSHQM